MPLFEEYRELILRKCESGNRAELRRIFEKEAFGELERLVTQKILSVAKEVLCKEIHELPLDSSVAILDPVINSWDIDLKTFSMEFVINRDAGLKENRRFEFAEVTTEESVKIEPGFEQFLKEKSLSGDATETEIEFLKALRFEDRQPTPLYYYRELQSLRDPLHFLKTIQLF